MSKKLLLPEQVATPTKSLRDLVKKILENYFSHLGNHSCPKNIYQMVTEEVENPMLQVTLNYAKGNQSLAAEILGISRNTLRKKLKYYDIDQEFSPLSGENKTKGF